MMKFEIIGKLKAMKETETFHPYEVKDFEKSGWQNTTLKFNILSGNNRFVGTVAGGKWKDDSKNRILTRSRSYDGKPSQNIEIAWDKRRDPSEISKVAGWKIYTVDLLSYSERKKIEDEGTYEEKLAAAKKKYQFLEKTDMAQLMQKVLTSGKYDDAVFKIQGDVEVQYNADKDQYYRTLTINKIYRVEDDTAHKAEMNIEAFYTADSLDTENYDETKKYMFNCYTDYYFNNVKATRFVPVTLVVNGDGDEATQKQAEGFKRKFTTFDDEAVVRKISLVCTMIDGAEEKPITIADLDEATREDIEYGLISEKDAIAALGGTMYGNKVTETRVKSIAKSSVKGSEPTVYSLEDINRKPVAQATPASAAVEVDDDDEIDLFSDDEI